MMNTQLIAMSNCVDQIAPTQLRRANWNMSIVIVVHFEGDTHILLIFFSPNGNISFVNIVENML